MKYYAKQVTIFKFNALNANLTKCSNTLKQFIGKLSTDCLSVFDHFVRWALEGLIWLLDKFLNTARLEVNEVSMNQPN